LPPGDTQAARFTTVAPALYFTDDFARLEEQTRRVLAAARDRRAMLAVAFALPWRAHGRLVTGDLAGALEDSEVSLAMTREGVWSTAEAMAAGGLGLARLLMGDVQGARDALDAAYAADPDNLTAHDLCGRLSLLDGDPARALAAFEAWAAAPQATMVHHNPAAVPWRAGAALARHAMGDVETARALADEELALAEAVGLPRPLGTIRRVRALVGAAGDAVVDELEHAVALLRESPARVDLARALIDLGATQRRAGRRRAAQEALAEALDLADRMSAGLLADRAREELRVAGARPRRARLTGAGALTASERRIARLAADGSTNGQIARALFLSPKTVEWHLSNIYSKLQVRSRHELPAALEAEGEATGAA
jgi:DNA-binding CsgD family transcriptional regulator